MATEVERQLADSALVCRAQAGESDAMHDLISAVRPAIFRYCWYRLSSYPGGRDAADDAAQETCLAVSRVLGDYRDNGAPFSAWVYAIAANKVTDVLRRGGRSAVLVEEYPEQVEPSLTPEERAMASVEVRTVLALIEQLPARMREVLMRRASGATARSVAEDLGMSAGAVDVAHSRAVARLRELVDGSEEYRDLFASFCAPARRPLRDCA